MLLGPPPQDQNAMQLQKHRLSYVHMSTNPWKQQVHILNIVQRLSVF